MILDTPFLVDLLGGDESLGERLDDLTSRGVPAVSSVTVMELWEGIDRVDPIGNERRVVEALLRDIEEYPFDHACAVTAAEVGAALRTADETFDRADVMIAATALVHDEPVVTRDVAGFTRIDGLDVIQY